MKRFAVFTGLIALTIAALAKGPVQGDRSDLILRMMRERASQQHDIWFDLGDYPRAVQSLRLLHEIFPHDYALATDLGWMEENVENYAAAIETYVGYRKAWPDDPEASFPEAQLYYMKKLYAKVPPILEPSIKMATHPHPDTYRLLASSYEHLGFFADSLRIWDLYLGFAKNDGQALVNRARVEKKRTGQIPADTTPPAARKK